MVICIAYCHSYPIPELINCIVPDCFLPPLYVVKAFIFQKTLFCGGGGDISMFTVYSFLSPVYKLELLTVAFKWLFVLSVGNIAAWDQKEELPYVLII